MHKFSFNFETISDERRNALMEAMLYLFDSAMRGDDKATVTYENNVKAGNWKEQFKKSYTWGIGEGAPSLRSFGIWFVQRNLFDEHYVGSPTTPTTAQAESDESITTTTDGDGGTPPPSDYDAQQLDGEQPDPLEKFRLFVNALAELDNPAEAEPTIEQVAEQPEPQVEHDDTENPIPSGECATCHRPCYHGDLYCGGDVCTFGITGDQASTAGD